MPVGFPFNNTSSIANGGTGATTAIGAQANLGITPCTTINGLGDSITIGGSFQTLYQPYGSSIATLPQWLPNTAYLVGQLVQNNSLPYTCSVAGTSASSGGPSTIATSITDGTVTWSYKQPSAIKSAFSFLTWAEKFSNGVLNWDMSQGYAGITGTLIKLIIVNGGSNYTAPTITLDGNATATLQVTNGVITGYTITQPGQSLTYPTATISDSTGSGAIIWPVFGPSGTFGMSSDWTQGMVYRLPDCLASNVDVFTVHGGTNDVANNVSYSTIIANLRTCYETLINGGRRVIAIPILPRTGLTNAQTAVLMRVNHWIRAYCRKESWANPLGATNIRIADATGYLTDGTSLLNYPIGGAGGTANAMMQDGLHPACRGSMYIGYSVWQAYQAFDANNSSYVPRTYTMFDGADPTANPGGNLLEGLPWAASTAVILGQIVSNSSNIYSCRTAGTTASSGGPSGTGSTITDGTAQWRYLRPQGTSVFASGTSGTNTAGTGVTYVGNLAGGYTLSHTNGSATVTITENIENPWSTGQIGQRQVIAFSLGSGTVNEQFRLAIINTSYTGNIYGIAPSDLGVTPFYCECELELSGVANLQQISLQGITDLSGNSMLNYDCYTQSTLTQGHQWMSSNGEMAQYPNNGKLYFRTQPMIIPPNVVNLNVWLQIGFDGSGAAGSATATMKLNYFGIRKAQTA